MTLPSALNMLTSSMAWMGCTFNFLRAPWSFLSSVPPLLWTFLTFLLGVPLPLRTLLVRMVLLPRPPISHQSSVCDLGGSIAIPAFPMLNFGYTEESNVPCNTVSTLVPSHIARFHRFASSSEALTNAHGILHAGQLFVIHDGGIGRRTGNACGGR